MANKVISNTGPILHLSEIDLLSALNSFPIIFIPEEVKNELRKQGVVVTMIKKIKVLTLQGKFKDVAEIMVNKFNLDLGEAQSIALALQEKADYFLSDDLDARTVGKMHGLEVHGSVGILLRAYRENSIDKKTEIKKVNALYLTSSLFITRPIIHHIIKEIENYRKK